MAYRKKRMMRRRPARKGGVVKRAVRRAKRTVFAKRVKTVVNRMVETKVANYSVGKFAISNWNNQLAYFGGTIKILTPSSATGGQFTIAQGTGQGSRVGNVITTQRMIMSGVVHINTKFNLTQNYNMCPLLVACYIFRTKPQLNQAGVLSLCNTDFFQAGNTFTGFSGYLNDLTKAVNKNKVLLLKKRVFKVGTQYVTSATALGQANTENQQFSDGTVGISKMFRMDLTKVMQKKLVFNDTDNGCVNSLTWIIWVPFRVDGELIVGAGDQALGPIPCYVDYNIEYYFKDA